MLVQVIEEEAGSGGQLHHPAVAEPMLVAVLLQMARKKFHNDAINMIDIYVEKREHKNWSIDGLKSDGDA